MYMYEKFKQLSLKEMLGYAIASEEAASKFYKHLVRDENINELVAHRFEHLAVEELVHMRALQCLYKKNYGDETPPIPEGLPPFESSVEVETVQNMIEALELGMQNEHNAIKVYTFLAHHYKDYRRLFKRLAAMEKGHYELLKHEKELFEDDIVEDPSVRHMPFIEPWKLTL
jgi:rubrerythrin